MKKLIISSVALFLIHLNVIAASVPRQVLKVTAESSNAFNNRRDYTKLIDCKRIVKAEITSKNLKFAIKDIGKLFYCTNISFQACFNGQTYTYSGTYCGPSEESLFQFVDDMMATCN